jgi:hypothetical protein
LQQISNKEFILGSISFGLIVKKVLKLVDKIGVKEGKPMFDFELLVGFPGQHDPEGFDSVIFKKIELLFIKLYIPLVGLANESFLLSMQIVFILKIAFLFLLDVLLQTQQVFI